MATNPNTIISYPDALQPLDGTESYAAWQNGGQKQITGYQLAQFLLAGIGAPTDQSEAAAALYAMLASQSQDAATAAAAITNVLGASVAAGGALPYEVTQITGGGGTGGAPGTYVGTTSGGAFPGFKWQVFVGSDGKAVPQIVNEGISTSNAAPTLMMPTIPGLTGSTTPVATVSAIPIGRSFYAPSSDGSQVLAWGNNGGTLASAPFGGTQLALPSVALVQAIAALQADTSFDNVYPDPALDTYSVGGSVTWRTSSGTAVNFPVVLTNGIKRQRLTASGTGAYQLLEDPIRRIALLDANGKPNFPNGLGASIVIDNKAAMTAGDVAYGLRAWDSSGALITSAGLWPTTNNDVPSSASSIYARYLPAAAVTAPTELVVAQLSASDIANLVTKGAVAIGGVWRIQAFTAVDFSRTNYSNGRFYHYKPAPVSGAQVSANALAVANMKGYAPFPNLFADPNFTSSGSSVTWTAVIPITTVNGRNWLSIPTRSNTTATSYQSPVIPFKGEAATFSMGLLIDGKAAGSLATDIQIRARAIATDGSNIGSAFTGNTGDGSDASYYAKNVPVAAITSPTWMDIALNIPKPVDPTGVKTVAGIAINIRLVNTTPAFRATALTIREGGDPTYKATTSSSSGAGVAVVYRSPTGNDLNDGLTSASPLLTLGACFDKLTAGGIVRMVYGAYGPEGPIDPTRLKGKVAVYGIRDTGTDYDGLPVQYLAAPLTGVTKTSGFTKVYQAQLTSPPTNANFNWAYQNAVPDPRTAITAGTDYPFSLGRSYRLPNCCRLMKTAATTLAAAQAEIDASSGNDPRAFIDDSTGILYFSIVGGGDATAAAIYMDDPVGLFADGTWASCGVLELHDIEFRYGGINSRPLREIYVNRVVICGSATNDTFYYSYARITSLETCCAGGYAGSVGDGAGGHQGAKISGSFLWTHDNSDDGFSDHEGCSSRITHVLTEYNGGCGCAPAYGSDGIYDGWTGRYNLQSASRAAAKPFDFCVTGAPSASTSGSDGGLSTNALFRDCESYNSGGGGFGSLSASTSMVARAINCRAHDVATYGFNHITVDNCRFGGSGTAKGSDVTVIAATAVT